MIPSWQELYLSNKIILSLLMYYKMIFYKEKKNYFSIKKISEYKIIFGKEKSLD